MRRSTKSAAIAHEPADVGEDQAEPVVVRGEGAVDLLDRRLGREDAGIEARVLD